MLIGELLKVIEKALPPETAMEGDRLGLQVQSGIREVRNILITMELNPEVIDFAEAQKADCIITFHPLIFRPVLSISDNDRVGSLLTKLIKKSIALISVHTNFDSYQKGTSYIIAEKLGLAVSGFLVPDNSVNGFGMGIIAELDNPIKPEDLLKKVTETCCSPLRFCEGKPGKLIEKIAIVGGSGSSFIDAALEAGVDCLITADITYHTFHRVAGKMALIDPGHYEMEQFVAEGLAALLKRELENTDIESINISNITTNPVLYYPNTDYYLQSQKELLISITNKWCNPNGIPNF